MILVKKKLLFHFLFLVYRRAYKILYRKLCWVLPPIKRPHIIEIELTNNCNLECVHCHRSNMDRKVGNMKYEHYTRLIDELETFPISFLRIVGQGESALHPQFSEMMKYASNKNIKIELTTNGALFDLYSDEEILSWDIDILGISVDGIDKSSYQKIRVGGNYDKLASNIRSFYSTKNKLKVKYPRVCVRNVIFPNIKQSQITDFKARWAPHTDYITFNTLNTFNSTLNMNPTKKHSCNEIFFEAHIRNDGSVLLCSLSFLYDNMNAIGNLREHNLEQIWKSKRLKYFRQTHRKGKHSKACISCFSNSDITTIRANSRKNNYSKNKVINKLNRVIDVS